LPSFSNSGDAGSGLDALHGSQIPREVRVFAHPDLRMRYEFFTKSYVRRHVHCDLSDYLRDELA
jgi:hypothetical protein